MVTKGASTVQGRSQQGVYIYIYMVVRHESVVYTYMTHAWHIHMTNPVTLSYKQPSNSPLVAGVLIPSTAGPCEDVGELAEGHEGEVEVLTEVELLAIVVTARWVPEGIVIKIILCTAGLIISGYVFGFCLQITVTSCPQRYRLYHYMTLSMFKGAHSHSNERI